MLKLYYKFNFATEPCLPIYDKEGYRDEEFDKKDKGTWIVGSTMTIEPKGKYMESRGIFLYINHNTRTTKGYYYVRKTTDDSKGRLKDDEKRYPVKWNTIKLFQRSRYLMTN